MARKGLYLARERKQQTLVN